MPAVALWPLSGRTRGRRAPARSKDDPSSLRESAQTSAGLLDVAEEHAEIEHTTHMDTSKNLGESDVN
jgi:hypothetical protein